MIRFLLYRFFPYYLVMLLLIGGGLLLGSETGLNLIWKQLSPRLPAELKIDSVQGRLFERIQLRGLRYESESLQITVRDAWLSWSPSALLDRRIAIDEVVLLGTRIQQTGHAADEADTAATSLPEKLPDLPNLKLSQLLVRDLEYLSGDQSVFLLAQAELSAALNEQDLSIQVSRFNSRETGPWQAHLDGLLQSRKVQVKRLRLTPSEYANTEIQLAGECQWPSLDCLASVQWQELSWPLDETRWRSNSGNSQFRWLSSDRDLKIAARLSGEQVPNSELNANVRWHNENESWIGNLVWADAAHANSELKLEASFKPSSSDFSATARPKNIDLSHWLDAWSSQLNGQIHLHGSIQPELKLQTKQVALTGSLRDQPLVLNGQAAYSGQSWSVDKLFLNWGGNSLRGTIGRGSTWNGVISVAAPHIAAMSPDFAGKLSGEFKFSGESEIPHVEWSAQGQHLKWQDNQLETFNSNGLVDLENIQVQLELRQLEAGPVLMQSLQLNSSGSPNKALSVLQLSESRGNAELEFQTHWNPSTQQFNANISHGLVTIHGENQSTAWRLSEDVAAQWKQGDLLLERQCWKNKPAELCATFKLIDQQASGQLNLDKFGLQRLQNWLPVGNYATGDIGIDLILLPSKLSNPTAQFQVTTAPVSISRELGDEHVELLSFDSGSVLGELRDNNLSTSWQLPLQHTQSQSGFWGEAQYEIGRDLNFQGHIKLDDIGIISAFSPEILQASGPLQASFGMRGPPESAALTGRLEIGPAQIKLDQPNIELSNIKLALQSQANDKIALNADLNSGDGRLKLAGELENWRKHPLFKATLKGDQLLLVDTSEARVVVSPNLTLEAAPPNIKLRGKVLISEAEIRPEELNASSAISPDEDQVIVGEKTAADKPLRIDSEILLALSDKVRVEALGLSSGIQGQLKTRLKPEQVTTAVGKLRLIDGRYKAYGQDLMIEKGELIFSGGPITEPGVDLKAFRQARTDVRAGVIVRGPIRNPRVSLYSDPNMRETDQLSYLVLGRAAEAQSDEDQAVLNNAALALGLKGSDLLAKRFKSQLGLDEVSIGTQPGEDANQASLVLGKYLSPDIYVSYGVGLFEPVYTFKLRYQLSRHWTLQTESGIESGGDLYYTVER